MNYELAKKLKEAGYVQPENMEAVHGDMVLGDDLVYRPTLEELIEACPRQYEKDDCLFNLVIKYMDGDEWFAGYEFMHGWNAGGEGNGSTPSIAVANLWLSLNK